MKLLLQKLSNLYYGWWLAVIFGLVLVIGSTTLQLSISLLVDPIINEFGWPLVWVSAAFALRSETTALAAPIIGRCIDKFGPRRTQMVGLLIILGSLFWLSRVDSLIPFYAAFCLYSVGSSATGAQIAGPVIARWFVKKRSRAMLVMYLLPGIASITIPIYGAMIEAYGWRGAQVAWAIVIMIVCVPLSFKVRDYPEDMGLLPDGEPMAPGSGEKKATPQDAAAAIRQRATEMRGGSLTTRQALMNGTFWRLAIAMMMTSFTTGPVLQFFVSALTREGVSREMATAANASLLFMYMVVRLGLIKLGDWFDRRDRRDVTATSLLFYGSASILLAVTTGERAILLIPFLVLYAIANGMAAPLRTQLTADYFGVESMGTIQGILQFLTTLGSILGPLQVGWMTDITGSYRASFILMGVLTIAAVPLMLSLPKANQASAVRAAPPVATG